MMHRTFGIQENRLALSRLSRRFISQVMSVSSPTVFRECAVGIVAIIHVPVLSQALVRTAVTMANTSSPCTPDRLSLPSIEHLFASQSRFWKKRYKETPFRASRSSLARVVRCVKRKG
jgi:hypothetical protein